MVDVKELFITQDIQDAAMLVGKPEEVAGGSSLHFDKFDDTSFVHIRWVSFHQVFNLTYFSLVTTQMSFYFLPETLQFKLFKLFFYKIRHTAIQTFKIIGILKIL